jgi:hypothetical protein
VLRETVEDEQKSERSQTPDSYRHFLRLKSTVQQTRKHSRPSPGQGAARTTDKALLDHSPAEIHRQTQ